MRRFAAAEWLGFVLSFIIQAPLKGHPKGVPCAELASRRLD